MLDSYKKSWNSYCFQLLRFGAPPIQMIAVRARYRRPVWEGEKRQWGWQLQMSRKFPFIQDGFLVIKNQQCKPQPEKENKEYKPNHRWLATVRQWRSIVIVFFLNHRFPPRDKNVKTVTTNDTECGLEQWYLSTVRGIEDGDNSVDIGIWSKGL